MKHTLGRLSSANSSISISNWEEHQIDRHSQNTYEDLNHKGVLQIDQSKIKQQPSCSYQGSSTDFGYNTCPSDLYLPNNSNSNNFLVQDLSLELQKFEGELSRDLVEGTIEQDRDRNQVDQVGHIFKDFLVIFGDQLFVQVCVN